MHFQQKYIRKHLQITTLSFQWEKNPLSIVGDWWKHTQRHPLPGAHKMSHRWGGVLPRHHRSEGEGPETPGEWCKRWTPPETQSNTPASPESSTAPPIKKEKLKNCAVTTEELSQAWLPPAHHWGRMVTSPQEHTAWEAVFPQGKHCSSKGDLPWK